MNDALHVRTEGDALGFALGLVAGQAIDRRNSIAIRRIAIEAYDLLAERAAMLGLDLRLTDPDVNVARRAIGLVDSGDSPNVPSGSNG